MPFAFAARHRLHTGSYGLVVPLGPTVVSLKKNFIIDVGSDIHDDAMLIVFFTFLLDV